MKNVRNMEHETNTLTNKEINNRIEKHEHFHKFSERYKMHFRVDKLALLIYDTKIDFLKISIVTAY